MSLEAAEKHVTFAPIRNAIMAGISNLTKWYRKLDACHVYAVSNGMSNQTALGTIN
jgi:endonuclease IV